MVEGTIRAVGWLLGCFLSTSKASERERNPLLVLVEVDERREELGLVGRPVHVDDLVAAE